MTAYYQLTEEGHRDRSGTWKRHIGCYHVTGDIPALVNTLRSYDYQCGEGDIRTSSHGNVYTLKHRSTGAVIGIYTALGWLVCSRGMVQSIALIEQIRSSL